MGGVARAWATLNPSTSSPPLSVLMRSGTGATSPQSRSMSSPYRRSALSSSLAGSARCGAPFSCT